MIKKGEEIRLFQFGGSGIIVAFENGQILFDEGLLSVSRWRIMMDVQVGMSLGSSALNKTSCWVPSYYDVLNAVQCSCFYICSI